jgi:hypothetical protein
VRLVEPTRHPAVPAKPLDLHPILCNFARPDRPGLRAN